MCQTPYGPAHAMPPPPREVRNGEQHRLREHRKTSLVRRPTSNPSLQYHMRAPSEWRAGASDCDGGEEFDAARQGLADARHTKKAGDDEGCGTGGGRGDRTGLVLATMLATVPRLHALAWQTARLATQVAAAVRPTWRGRPLKRTAMLRRSTHQWHIGT